MFLSKIEVTGFRAASSGPLTCILPGRFAVLLGANNSGKSTVADAITIAHTDVFPWPARTSSAALSSVLPERTIRVEYAYEAEEKIGIWDMRQKQHMDAPNWTRGLVSTLGRTRSSLIRWWHQRSSTDCSTTPPSSTSRATATACAATTLPSRPREGVLWSCDPGLCTFRAQLCAHSVPSYTWPHGWLRNSRVAVSSIRTTLRPRSRFASGWGCYVRTREATQQ